MSSQYPVSRFHFRVDWGGTRTGFSEVSGLTIEMEAPGFRDGSSPEYSKVRMPGPLSYPRLVLRRPVLKGDTEFYDWLNTAKLNTVERRDIIVAVLNEKHVPVVTWKFKNSFPVKLDYSPLNSTDGGPLIETLEIVHEGMTLVS